MNNEVEKRLAAIEGKQDEIVMMLRQLLPSQAQLDLKNLARKVVAGDRQALREFNATRKTGG
ncbi:MULTISPECIES: hypothetical protein [Geobacter]|uniref:hypothetical protein n=1 Tax=Geobacter TaxID=28231 RepID=UPI0020B89303|nr:hypothetical protein [Geobacter sulfurreducens]UTG93162.1 hypothetical protein J8622_02185 [Geobacter sulfurreducens]BET60299.1 hypothetical protein GEO60473_33390 [Geobacter sp. 60473]